MQRLSVWQMAHFIYWNGLSYSAPTWFWTAIIYNGYWYFISAQRWSIICWRFYMYAFQLLHYFWCRINISFMPMSYTCYLSTWWRNQMETFSALLAICAGNSTVSGEFPAQRPVTRSFDIFFDLRLNERLSKQAWGWWFESLSCPLWRQCNDWKHEYCHLPYRYMMNLLRQSVQQKYVYKMRMW